MFLPKKKIKGYVYESKGRVYRGKQLNYYCMNPKRFKSYQNNKLNHEQKFKKCGYKVTKLLESFT